MIDVSKVKNIVFRIAGKQLHGMPSINDFNTFLELANLELFNEQIGNVRDYYLRGGATTKSMFGITKKVNQNLRPFIVTRDLLTRNEDDIFQLDANVAYIDTVELVASKTKVTWADNPLRYIGNSVDEPTVDYPIYADVAGGIEVFPESITSVFITYIREPLTPLYATEIIEGQVVQDEGNSVNLEWDTPLIGAIVARLLKPLGMEVRDDEIRQYAQIEQQITG